MPTGVADKPGEPPRAMPRSPQDFAAGLFLLALACFGFLGSLGLSFGKLSTVGPGLMPRSMAVLIAVLGLLLVVQSLTTLGARLEAWSVRSIILVLGAVCVFAYLVRPIGLAVAGPLAMIIASFADRDTRPLEIAIFAAILTLLSVGLFKFLLRLPIPVLPLVLGY